jgi:hypothetical protein
MRAVEASCRVLAILILLGGMLNGRVVAQTTPTPEAVGSPPGAANPTNEGATSDFAGPGSAASVPAVSPNLNPSESQPPAPTPFLLMKLLGIPNDSPLRVYGWIQNSFTGNTDGTPRNGENFALFPNHLANQWMGNQYYFVLERTMARSGSWDYGYRLDTLFGNDAEFTHAVNLLDNLVQPDQFANFDLPQFYGEAHLPILTSGGVDLKFGRWYNFAGFETVTAIQRPLLSWAYTMPYFPFTFSGVNANFHVSDNLEIWAGAVNGPDRWFDRLGVWNPLAGFRLSSSDNRSAWTTVLTTGPSPTQIAGVPGTRAGNDRTYLSSLVTFKWNDRLTQAVEFDLIAARDLYSPVANRTFANADYFVASTWLIYQFNDKVSGVSRNEVFRDDQGAATGVADTYYESTLGLILKPQPWLWVRPEIRYDWAQYKAPFDDGTRGSRLTIGADVIFLY